MSLVHPKQQLEGTGIKPKRSFGQNFLTDDGHLGSIARVVLGQARDADHTVVELGSGLGALTAFLLDQGARVHAVERDRDLVPLLKKRFADVGDRLTVHEDNALTVSLDVLDAGGALCGNLPYHLAASLCLRALDRWPRIGGAAFLVQNEVAERIAAGPGSRDYGVLSVLLQSRFAVSVPVFVPRGAFWPVPDVDGGLVLLEPLPAPRGGDVSIALLKSVVKPAFQKRRKTMKNALSSIDDSVALMAAAGIDPTSRAEELPVEGFARLAALLGARDGAPPVAVTARDADDDAGALDA